MFTKEGDWIRQALIEAIRELRQRPRDQTGPYIFIWNDEK